MIKTAYGETFMSRATMFRWHKKFQEGREEVRDEERCGRERDVRTPDLVDKFASFWMRTVGYPFLQLLHNLELVRRLCTELFMKI